MNIELLILFILSAPLVGAVITALAPINERRWTMTLTLLILLGAFGLSYMAGGEHSKAYFGHLALRLDPFSLTIGPALLVSRIAILLTAGRSNSAATNTNWHLALLAVEFFALLTSNPAFLLLAESVSAVVLALRSFGQGLRLQSLYLVVEILVLAVTLPQFLDGSIHTFADTPPASALAIVFVGLVRMGVFPFSTAILSGLTRKFDSASLASAFPVGGVLLVIRFSPQIESLHFANNVLIIWLAVAAPLSAAMAIAQRSLPRAIGHTLMANFALLALLGIDHSQFHEAVAGEFWAATLLSGTGLGAAAYLAALRFGDIDLFRYSGFERHTPKLGACFLILGFALAGAPGTIQFVAEDFLLNTTRMGLGSIILVVMTIALMGFAILRMHFRIFAGRERLSRDYMILQKRESMALVATIAAIVMGGVFSSSVPLVSAVKAQREGTAIVHQVDGNPTKTTPAGLDQQKDH